jgi:nitrogen regulatory protein PII
VKCIVGELNVEETTDALEHIEPSGAHGRVFVIPLEEAYTIRTRAGWPD